MSAKNYFENIDLRQIEEFVTDSYEEDLHIEFKTANHPARNDFDKKNFSKSISGFANSLGGIIVWGIEASKNEKGIDAANKLKPIKALSKFSNYLKKIEGISTTPSVVGIEYKKIEVKKDIGFIKVLVPPSENVPHMAIFSKKHYYKRNGDNFYICEHYDIMDLVNRQTVPILDLKIVEARFQLQYKNNNAVYKFEAVMTIINSGKAIAKFPALNLKFESPFRQSEYGLDNNYGRGLPRFPSGNRWIRYGGDQGIVIHAHSELEIDKVISIDAISESSLIDLNIDYEIMAERFATKKGTLTIKKSKLIGLIEKVRPST